MDWQYLFPVWLATVCYFVVEVVRPWTQWRLEHSARRPRSRGMAASEHRRSRWDALWLIGSLLTWIHIVLAYQIAHGGSHAEALHHTAEVTRQIFGVPVAAGLYVNFAFAGLWTLDACGRLWGGYNRWPPLLKRLIHLFLAFVLFQATIVFGSCPMRWTAAAGFTAMLAVRGMAAKDR